MRAVCQELAALALTCSTESVDDAMTVRLARVQSRVSPASWQKRVERAQLDEDLILAILQQVDRGTSLNEAMAEVLPASRRGWALRRIARYQAEGLGALIEARLPREPEISVVCRQALQVARAANPQVSREEAVRILESQGILPLPSDATIRREFARVDARRRYARQRDAAEGTTVVDLPFAGAELLAAAEAETGGIASLTDEVVRVAKRARAASVGRTPRKDTAYRNHRGQFTVTYNRRRRRKPGEDVAPYLRPAGEKAVGRVRSWPRFVRERRETIEAKLRMLTFGWAVAETKGWNALRSPEAVGLESVTGFAYMPSTLAKLVSALAITGLGPLLLTAVGRRWHAVAEKRWGEPGAMAAVYIDNHAKEVWSKLFTQSGKVSHRSRVMPCITTTYAHTGAGTPLVLSVQSGSAPLAPRLIELVERAEAVWGAQVERATVIDAEGSTFDLLESFASRQRVLVTPLRPSRAPELELSYSRGSYFRPYREKDELRVARATLTHKSTGRSLELGALVVRRRKREADTILLTTGLGLGMEGRDLADLYFSRWPVQENAFKEAVALGLHQHRGNCGRMVANLAVLTELEELQQRAERDSETLEQLRAESGALALAADERDRENVRARARLATRRGRFDELVLQGKTSGTRFARVALEHQQALVEEENSTCAAKTARVALEKNQARRAALGAGLQKLAERRKYLQPQQRIRKVDVAQDMILTATKLTAAQLISFAKREYLCSWPMTPDTFLSRVLPIRGRKEVQRDGERVIFYQNVRDPEVTTVLRNACGRLNKRRIRCNGRRMRYAVEAPPPR